MNIAELESKTMTELQEMAREYDITGYSRLKKHELTMRLLQAEAESQGLLFGGGILDIVSDGIGFLRSGDLLPSSDDIYVSQSQIRRFGLRAGDTVIGQVRPPKENEKYFGLLRVEAVNNVDPELAKRRPWFDRLTPIFPREQLRLESGQLPLSTRLLDMLAPIGRG
ncbi:MAG: Rho termination factor N-terminal domain-containing protein, partial [Anaerolineae bacterium]